jgi:hypothetical protein
MQVTSSANFQYYAFAIKVLKYFTNFKFMVEFTTSNNKFIYLDNINFIAYSNLLQDGDFEDNYSNSAKNPWQIEECLNGCNGSIVQGIAESGVRSFYASGSAITLYQNLNINSSQLTTIDHVAFWLKSNCQLSDQCYVTIDIRLPGS